MRSRDPEVIKEATYVVDVGAEYDPSRNRFDHHQEGGAGERENGIPYASFGLVWKQYGAEACGDEDIARRVDERLVQPTDAADNGVAICSGLFEGVAEYTVHDLFSAFVPTWREEDADSDVIFRGCVEIAVLLLRRETQRARDDQAARSVVADAYRRSEDRRIIVLDRYCSWKEVLLQYPEPLFVVYPREDDGTWHVRAVPRSRASFESRQAFPISWAAKSDEDLVRESGVSDAVFCHGKRFLAVARSREGAVTLAERALA